MRPSLSYEKNQQAATPGLQFNSIFIDSEEMKQLPEYKDLNRLTNSLYYDQSVYFKRSFNGSRLYNTTSCFEAKKKRKTSYDETKPFVEESADYTIDNSDLIFKDKVYSRTRGQLQNIYMKLGISSKDQYRSPHNELLRRTYLEKFSGERQQQKKEQQEKLQERLAKVEERDGEKVFVTSKEAVDLSGLSMEDERKLQAILKKKIKQEKEDHGQLPKRSKKKDSEPDEEEKEVAEHQGKKASPKRPKTSPTRARVRFSSTATGDENISWLDHVKKDFARQEREKHQQEEIAEAQKEEQEKQQLQREEKAATTVAFKNNLISKKKFAHLFTGKWIPEERVQQAIEAGDREPIVFQVIDKFQPANASNSNPFAMLLSNDRTVYNDKQLEARKKNIDREQKTIMRVVKMCTPSDRDVIKETRRQFQRDMLVVKAVPLSWDPNEVDQNRNKKNKSRTPTPFKPITEEKTIQQENLPKEQLFQTEVTNLKRPQSQPKSVASSNRPSTANNTISVKPKSSSSQRNHYDFIVAKNTGFLNMTHDGFRMRPKSTERTEGLISRKSQYSRGGFRGSLIKNMKASARQKGTESAKSDKFQEENAKTELILHKLDELQEHLFDPVKLSKKMHKKLDRSYQLIDEKYDVAKIEKEFMHLIDDEYIVKTVEELRDQRKQIRDDIETSKNDVSIREFMMNNKIKREKIWTYSKRSMPAIPKI